MWGQESKQTIRFYIRFPKVNPVQRSFSLHTFETCLVWKCCRAHRWGYKGKGVEGGKSINKNWALSIFNKNNFCENCPPKFGRRVLTLINQEERWKKVLQRAASNRRMKPNANHFVILTSNLLSYFLYFMRFFEFLLLVFSEKAKRPFSSDYSISSDVSRFPFCQVPSREIINLQFHLHFQLPTYTSKITW